MPPVRKPIVSSWRRKELVLRASSILVALWLAWAIVVNTTADSLVLSNPDEALSWQGDSSPALIALARQKLTGSDPQADQAAIRDLTERALLSSPLSERALSVLGYLADLDGHQDEADRLMTLAADRTRRDGFVQVWSFFRLARLGQFDKSLEHADSLLRSRSYLHEQITPTLLAFAMDTEAKAALVRLLAENPPWRGWYLNQLAGQTDNPGIAYAILTELKGSAHPPNTTELNAYLQNLIKAGRFEQAYLTWINFLPEERRRDIRFAYNGDFEYAPSGLPFDWMIGSISGASTDIVATADGKGHVARIEFSNRRVRYRHLSKLLMLPPGSYQLTGMARALDLENERGLVWRLSCAELHKQALGETEPVKGTMDWHPIAASFSVPQSGCRAQWLTLELPARAALEEQISGKVWFDDLLVSRALAESGVAN